MANRPGIDPQQPFLRPVHFAYGSIGASFVLLILFRERHITQLDPSNLFLAAKYGLNLIQERPHPPGYPFFVLIYRGISRLTGMSIDSAILLLNGTFAVAGLIAVWHLGKTMFEPSVAALGVALTAFNPVFLFYGCQSEMYVFDILIGPLAILGMCYSRPRIQKATWFLLGLAGGFRLSSSILIAGFMWIFMLVHERNLPHIARKLLTSATLFLLGLALWAIPFLLTVPVGTSMAGLFFDATVNPGLVSQSLITFATFLFWMLNTGLFVILFKAPNAVRKCLQGESRWQLLACWILIPSIYFGFRTYSKGYALLMLPAFSLAVGWFIMNVRSIPLRKTAMILLPGTGLAIFLIFPFVSPPLELATRQQNAPLNVRFRCALERLVSFYAPTQLHLTQIDLDFDTFSHGLSAIRMPDSSTIVIDHAAAMRMVPRALEVARPDLKIVSASNDATSEAIYYERDSIRRGFNAFQVLSNDTVYFVTDSRSEDARRELAGATFIDAAPFRFYRVVSRDMPALRRILTVHASD